MQYWLAVILCLVSVSPLMAAEIEGVHIPDQAVVEGKPLQLNGAGVRTKFFFNIYVGALYLPQTTTSAEEAIKGLPPKRVSMYIIYDKVEREKLVGGWVAGFEKNQSKEALASLKQRLDQFNAMFDDAARGEVMTFDFLTDGTTLVTIRGNEVGRIAGADFQQALLAVWLGKKPADRGLKDQMLIGEVAE